MELNKIEQLITKYFEGGTTVEEEKVLRSYFISEHVAEELLVYRPFFVYFDIEKHAESVRPFYISTENRNYSKWFAIAASIMLIGGIGFYWFQQEKPEQSLELGTFEDPEQAFAATQKALVLLSGNVNKGIESVRYVQTYEDTRDKIFVVEQ